MKYLIPSHFSAPIDFTKRDCIALRKKVNFSSWGGRSKEVTFLEKIDRFLLNQRVVPKNPLQKFKD